MTQQSNAPSLTGLLIVMILFVYLFFRNSEFLKSLTDNSNPNDKRPALSSLTLNRLRLIFCPETLAENVQS